MTSKPFHILQMSLHFRRDWGLWSHVFDGVPPRQLLAECYCLPDSSLSLVTSTRWHLRNIFLLMYPLIITPGHLIRLGSSLVHEDISSPCTYHCRHLLSLIVIQTRLSVVLHITFHLFLCTAGTLPLVLLFILVTQFLDTVFVTVFLNIGTRGTTLVVPIDFWQLSRNPRVKGSDHSTGPLKQLRSWNVLGLTRLWSGCSGHCPSLLPWSSHVPGVLLHQQKSSLRSISWYLTSISFIWS